MNLYKVTYTFVINKTFSIEESVIIPSKTISEVENRFKGYWVKRQSDKNMQLVNFSFPKIHIIQLHAIVKNK